ncbi:MAG: dTMP kinase [Gammaproteobacteria bacterium]|nr:dTMP kinase [Gammaproteobacteria bacterium]
MVKGCFVVLEGGEGAGKSTQAALLARWLRDRGVPCTLAREPGSTGVGEAIREVVLGRTDLEMPAESELLLILAARAAFVREVVRPALARGDVVVADRFDLSTLAYQGYGRGLDLARVRAAMELATGGLRADLYLVLDVPVAEGAARRRAAGGSADRIERAGADFLRAVREGYLELAGAEDRVELVSGLGTPDQVRKRILECLSRHLPGVFGSAAEEPRAVDGRGLGGDAPALRCRRDEAGGMAG